MKQRYILLPEGGIRPSQEARGLLFRTFEAARDHLPIQLAGVPADAFRVIDTVHEDDVKLVELEPATAEAINRSPIPLRALPEVVYRLPEPFTSTPARPAVAPVAAAQLVIVRCVDGATGAPLAGRRVDAFDNLAAGTGDWGITNGAGEVSLRIGGAIIDLLYVPTDATHWGVSRRGVPIVHPVVQPITPLSAAYADAIRQLYPLRRFNSATGVTVGILDTGVGPHADLNLVGGRCTVTGQPPHAHADIDTHGTHVAGLVGGRGGLGTATLGLAPDVVLRPYRVFDFYNGELGATNYAILKAMIFAATDGCDILNLSLGGGPWDQIVAEAITDAREHGMLVVVAAGNGGRQPVNYPAAYFGATAVSAMGRDNGFPPDSPFVDAIQRPPYGTPADPQDFLASFSNVGPQVACTGLGVGVLSTLPHNGFGPMSGTSMAAPMVAGAAASLLSQQPATYALPRDRNRAVAIERLLLGSCRRRLGGGQWEGSGLPDPTLV